MTIFDKKEQREKARAELFWEQTLQSSRLATLVAIVSCAVLWPFVEHTTLVLWGIATAVLSQGRIFFLARRRRRGEIDNNPGRFLRVASYSMVFPGIAWMSLVYLYIPADDPNVFLIVLFLVAGMVSNSIPALSSSVPAYLSFITPPAIALISISLWTGSWKLAIILVLSVGGLIAMAKKNNLFISRAITLDIENKALLEDVTRAKNEVEQANQSKSRFLAGISHDLRQPLQALTIYLDLLRPFQKQSEPRYLTDQANRAQNELSDAFNTMLELSRFDLSEVDTHPAVVDMEHLCREIAEHYRVEAEQIGLAFNLQLVSAVCHTDRFLVGRILNNLLSNAIKFTEKGQVELIATIADGSLTLSVRDTGAGISVEDQKAIFQEYYQVDPRQRRNGVGLGLNLSKSLCDALGSVLQVKSEPGVGSELSFALPLDDSGALPAESSLQDAASFPLVSSESIDMEFPSGLLTFIEDNPSVSDAMSRLFSEWGWTVDHYRSFEHWCSSDKPERPDLIISDYDLPSEDNGIRSIEKIRDHWRTQLPSIVLTGRSDAESLNSIKSARIYPLKKPVKLPQLKTAIHHLLE